MKRAKEREREKGERRGESQRESQREKGERRERKVVMILHGVPTTNHLCYGPEILWVLSTAIVLNTHVVASKKNFS